ncbi:MAG TPA: aminotransferase class IV [Candidatus Angelobacter sp.]|nr:aminotransferase class IV [Candidatus Angelobacter sp.]
MHPYVLHNDQIVSATEPVLRPGQLGLLSGWGVFTTFRIYDGVPFAFERHWRRLSRDAQLLHVPLAQNPEQIRADLFRLIDANDAREAVLRLCIVRNEGSIWAGPGSGNPSDVIAMTNNLQQWKDTARLSVASNIRYTAFPFAGTKTLSWAHSLTLVETARHEGFDEVILLNERGEATECTSANLFATKDGVTCTPPLSSGASPGVTRATMLEELDLADTPVIEKALCVEDLYQADEVFITSTSRELLPVECIQNRVLAGAAGHWPVMTKLRQALRNYVQRYIEKQKRAATANSL